MSQLLAMLLAIALTATAAAAPVAGPEGAPFGVWREQIHWIPMQDDHGATRLLYTRVCRPKTHASARLAVINHGSPPRAMARPGMQPAACDTETIRWFLDRGFVVVLPMRRGYGMTGGRWDEGGGSCSAADYERAGRESARDIEAVVNYATKLPFVRPDGVVMVGQSAGGWATLAVAARNDPRIVAYVDMQGGRGGHYHQQANSNCRPDQLAIAAGRFGAKARTRMIWVFASNDSYFAPDIVKAMYDAFTAAGGRAELHQLGPFSADGHTIFWNRDGVRIWGPLVEHYLAQP